MTTNSEIVVSISCITFNHRPYIEECIEGFLMQQCNFKFEVLIHDDASIDGTQELIKDYALKYPDIIKPILQKENQYSKGVRGMSRTFNYPRAKGKYIALCEGDDYWTDPLKLQKQVEFLEENPDYGLVFTDSDIYHQEKKIWKHNVYNNMLDRSIHSKDELFNLIIHGNYRIPTATLVFNAQLLNNIPKNKMSFLMGDTPMLLDLSQITCFKYLKGSTAVYRLLNESASRSKDKRKYYRFRLGANEMRIYYFQKYNYAISDDIARQYNLYLLTYLLFDSHYQLIYPLIKPTYYQRFKYKFIRNGILTGFYRFIWYIKLYARAVKRRIKKVF